MRLIHKEDDEKLIFRFLNGFFCVLYKSSSIFVHGNCFSLFGSGTFFLPFYLCFLKAFTSFFSTIAIRIYLCFAGEVVFRFHAFGFISYTTRVLNKTSFLWIRLVVKKINLEKIFPALQNWNVLHWTLKGRRFNLLIILYFGKDLLLKTWLQLNIVCKIKWWIQF